MYVRIQFVPGTEIPDWDIEIDAATRKRIIQNNVSDIREVVEECGIAWDEVSQVRLDDPSGIFYEAV